MAHEDGAVSPRSDAGEGAAGPKRSEHSGSVTVTSATAIGVGGMMGAGLYTLIGLATTTAGVWLPLAFVVGAFVAAAVVTPPISAAGPAV